MVGKDNRHVADGANLPKYVLLEPLDLVRGFIAVVLICILSSSIAIRAALKLIRPQPLGERYERAGIRIEGLSKALWSGRYRRPCAEGRKHAGNAGEVVGLIGPSGSGKEHAAQKSGRGHRSNCRAHDPGDEVIYDDGWKVRDLRALRRDKIGYMCSRRRI